MQQFLFNGYSSLIIGGCVRLTKKTFLSIPILANEFKTLNFSRCFFLDDEALLQILIHCKFLQKLHVTDCFALTDKAFKTVRQDHQSALIGLVDFDFSMCHLMGDDTLICLGEQATNLTSLGCSKTQITDDSIVNHIAPNCTQLTRLHLDECKALTGASVEALAQYCTNLVEIFLANDFLVSDSSLVKLAKSCTSLQTITLSQVNMLQKEPLIEMAKSCKLNYVDISWCGVDSEGLRRIAEFSGSTLETLKIAWCSRIKNDAIQDSIKHLSNLTELDISWKTPTDSIIDEITKHCKNLLVLDLSGCNEISEKAFELLGLGQNIDKQGNLAPNRLMSLSLAWCKNLTDNAIEKIVLGCPNLTSFDASLCSHITNNGIMSLKNVKNLRRLVLSRNSQITTDAFEFLKECTMVQTLCLPDVELHDEKFSELAQYMPSLRSLVVSGCVNIGDNTLLALAKYATSLKALAANGCKLITDEGVITLVKNLNYIVSLSLAEVSITDLGLKAIIDSCHSLQALTVSFCPYISDLGVTYVSKCAPLTNFEAGFCTQLSNLSFREVLRGCEMLKLVNFSSTEIDDELLDDVWMYCKHLTSMEIRGCTKLTNEQIKKCELLSPSLQIKK
jgi:hypothetical protein